MIDAALVGQIAEHYAKYRNDSAVMSRMREAFPSIHFTRCSDDDINQVSPFLEGNGFNVYLMGGDHCLTLINSLNGAKGVVLADVDSDDE